MTFDWYPNERPHKRVTLCNPKEYKEVTQQDVAYALMGMGLSEWEYYMGRLFTQAVFRAEAKGKNEADITEMFACDLVGIDRDGEYTKGQKSVIAFLMEKLFECVGETEDELKVKVKPNLFRKIQ